MKIFVNGDSHTCGSELYFPTQNGYAYQLAKLLKGEIVGNPAIGGAGNDRIERTTIDFLNECNGDYPDLIVIGWSGVTRTDWFYNGEITTYFSNDLPPDVARQINPTRVDYERNYLNNEEAHIVLSRYYQSKIYNLHCFLEYLNIPHLFFMGVHGLCDYLDGIEGGTYQFDWSNCFWNPYEPRPNSSFFSWGVGRGYEATKWFHLPEEAHEEFARVLYNHLLEHNIVES